MMCHIEVPHEILAEDIPVSDCNDDYAYETFTFMDIIRLGKHVPAMIAEDAENDSDFMEIETFFPDEAEAAYEVFVKDWLREYLGLEDFHDPFPGALSTTFEIGTEDFEFHRIVRVYTTKTYNV